MSQWGRPRHAGTRHNRRIRRGGTWTDQDRRLKRHQLGRFHRQRGHPETWSGQVRRLDRPRGSGGERFVIGILILGAAVIAVSAGGTVVIVLAVAALLMFAWHRTRPRRR